MQFFKTFFRLSIVASFAIFLLITSCTPDPTDPGGNGNTDLPDGDFGVNQTVMLDLVNAKRATGCKCGTKTMPAVAPLTWNNRLATAALKHSKDMKDNNYFDHTSKDGRSFSDRITAEGYNWLSAGENIAAGYTSEAEVVQGWFDSPGHCENMMSSSFTEIGAGRSGDFWTQDFGRPQ